MDLKYIIFVLAIFYSQRAIAWEKADRPCIDAIMYTKRHPEKFFGVMGRGGYSAEFWSHMGGDESNCYYRILDKSTGLKHRLEAAGYTVEIHDFKSICTYYCNEAEVTWAKQKNVGLSHAERKAVAEAWEKNERENVSACESFNSPAFCNQDEKISFVAPCVKKSGNPSQCLDRYFEKERGKK